MKTMNVTLILTAAVSLTACMGSSSYVCNDRLCLSNEKVSIDQSDVSGMAITSGITTQGLLDNLLSLTPTLTLVGTLNPPLVNGASVQASDVAVNGTKVYVAYNTAGNVQAGAIDVIDITNPYVLSLASQALYPTMDIHKVFVNSGKLYAAGATSANGGGGNLQKITLDASGKLTSTVSSVFLRSAADANVPAYAGTSVIASGNNVYALSGNNGGLTILNASDLSTRSFTALPEARDITLNGAGSSLFAVVGKTSGAEAGIKQFDLTGTAVPAGNLTLPNAQIDEGKSTILTGNTVHIATAGFGGARLICIGSGTTLGTAVNPTVSGLTSAEQTANAATFGAGYMFVANGEAGVSIYSVNTPLVPLGCNLVTITYLGRFSLGTDASVNNVFFTNGYLVAATGEKGFKIIKVTTSLLSGLLQAL